MKNIKKNLLYAILFVTFTLGINSCTKKDNSITDLLSNSPNVKVTEISTKLSAEEIQQRYKIRVDTNFQQNFELYFKQPIDHNQPDSAFFYQRVILSHVSKKRPVVVILEGYGIYNGRAHELTQMLGANQVVIEHRFFADSRPEKPSWQYLNVKQAAADQHHIIQYIKKRYPQSKIITTGISKGGQTTVFHKALYPDDTDVAVPYVAPMNRSNEDTRIYDFLKNVGTEAERTRLYEFQCLLFENKTALLPKLRKLAKQKDYHFIMGLERAYELSILEIPFAFWQWGTVPISEIPDKNANIDTLYKVWLQLNSLTFFEENHIEEIRPFFWQAMTEIGMYGYETAPFSKYLKDTTNIQFTFTLPPNQPWKYDPKTMQEIFNYLDTTTDHLLFIYGENDPWSATAYRPKEQGKNILSFFNPNGNHSTRIRSFPTKTQEEIRKKLSDWLEVSVKK